ncbi:MAG TPA: IS1 family transposase [Pyrinomonadaceae bacterium]|nr:IS1 family transposase [Pyrinomonadaceae bacterium]
MNKLPVAKRVQILSMLCEGVSMRSISRVVDVSINTVGKMLIDAGTVCSTFHDEKVRNVKAKRVQVDEVWSFTAAKQKNVAGIKRPVDGAGDTWTWTALDADSKLIVQWFVGARDGHSAKLFIDDLATRLANRVQLTTDGHAVYLDAVEGPFGNKIDYAQLVKTYGIAPDAEKRYSPPVCTGAKRTPKIGNPDWDKISTSHVERQNLTMRMSMRRYTRLTNAFSKKFESHVHMVALYTVWCNWVRIHKSLRVTPAMAAGLTDKLMGFEDIVALIDAREGPPKKRGPYKKQDEKNSN